MAALFNGDDIHVSTFQCLLSKYKLTCLATQDADDTNQNLITATTCFTPIKDTFMEMIDNLRELWVFKVDFAFKDYDWKAIITGMWNDLDSICKFVTPNSTISSLKSIRNLKFYYELKNYVDQLYDVNIHKVKGTKRVRSHSMGSNNSDSPIETQNKFTLLENIDLEDCNPDVIPPPPTSLTPKTSVQPIWIEYIKDSFRETKHSLITITNGDIKFNIAETSGVVKIKVHTPEMYRAVQSFITSSNRNCYSPRPKTEKPLKYVIKGFDSS